MFCNRQHPIKRINFIELNSEEPDSSFVPLKAKPDMRIIPKKRAYEKYSRDKRQKEKDKVATRKLNEKFKSVTSSIRKKEIKDIKKLYLVIELIDKIANSKKDKLLRTVYKTHAFLNEEHTSILVSISESLWLKYRKRGLPYYVQEPIKNIRELELLEQINKEVQNYLKGNVIKPILIHIIPNIDIKLNEEYMDILTNFFNRYENRVIWKSDSDIGTLLVSSDLENIRSFLSNSNIIFKVEKPPKGLLSFVSKKFFF